MKDTSYLYNKFQPHNIISYLAVEPDTRSNPCRVTTESNEAILPPYYRTS